MAFFFLLRFCFVLKIKQVTKDKRQVTATLASDSWASEIEKVRSGEDLVSWGPVKESKRSGKVRLYAAEKEGRVCGKLVLQDPAYSSLNCAW